MATITLTGNTNVSALTPANGDTIDLAGFQLTFNAQPTATGISVVSPGTAGSCVFSVATVIPTWNFTAGTRTPSMITTLPANCEIGNVTGGAAFNTNCVETNSGIVNNVFGGGNNSARGIVTNNGKIKGNVVGGTATAAYGIATNNGEIAGNVTGGTGAIATAIQDHRGTIYGNVTGGSNTDSLGIGAGFGLVLGLAKAGAGVRSYAIQTLTGSCIGGIENTGAVVAISSFIGTAMLIDGPNTKIAIPSQMRRIYSLFGPVNPLATIPVGAEVIELTAGGSGGFPLSRVLN